MEVYDITQAAEILEDLLDRAEAGEKIGITRDGKLVARLTPLDEPVLSKTGFKCRISSAPHWQMADSPLPFTPVPTARVRHDGWTTARQRDFIANLARIGVVTAAARAVGMSPKSAYALRKRAGEESEFAAAWDAALDEGRRRALDTAISRALHGERVPVFYGGRQIGEYVRYNDSLVIAALRASGSSGDRLPPSDGSFRWKY